MPKPQQYQRIADRYSEASELVNQDIPEAGAFTAYHAFESTGSAWIRQMGQNVPRAHRAKIDNFVKLSRGYPFGKGAATLATLLNALRNNMLYPIQDKSGNYILPETQMSAANSKDLLRRVRGIIRKVGSNI